MTTKLEYEAYARECAERARAEGIAEGEARGEVRGEVRGEAKGEANTRREVAKKMLADGLDINTIAKYTGLTESECRQLNEQQAQ